MSCYKNSTNKNPAPFFSHRYHDGAALGSFLEGDQSSRLSDFAGMEHLGFGPLSLSGAEGSLSRREEGSGARYAATRPRVGVTKALFIDFSVSKIFNLVKVLVRLFHLLNHIHIWQVWAAATPVKYKCDIQ